MNPLALIHLDDYRKRRRVTGPPCIPTPSTPVTAHQVRATLWTLAGRPVRIRSMRLARVIAWALRHGWITAEED